MESPPLSLVHWSKKVIVIILMLFVHRSKGANSISWIDCYLMCAHNSEGRSVYDLKTKNIMHCKNIFPARWTALESVMQLGVNRPDHYTTVQKTGV